MMDVVFSDTGNLGGGFFDNNSGWDYHIEIKGSTGQIRPLKVVHMTVEMAPVAKVRRDPRWRIVCMQGLRFESESVCPSEVCEVRPDPGSGRVAAPIAGHSGRACLCCLT